MHCSYTNQILVEYNVQCEAGRTAFIMFETLDLEPENCFDGTRLRYNIPVKYTAYLVNVIIYNNAGVKIMLQLMLVMAEQKNSVEILCHLILSL